MVSHATHLRRRRLCSEIQIKICHNQHCPFTNYFTDDIPLWDIESQLREYVIYKLVEPYIKVQYAYTDQPQH